MDGHADVGVSFDRSRRAPAAGARAAASPTAPGPGKQTRVQQIAAPVQRRASPGAAPDGPDVHAAAAQGTSGAATALPFRDQIQRSFGRHDVGRVQAHLDGAAAEGAGAMGAHGFAVGEHVAFGAAPDLHTAAHEAAHVVQQRGGVHLKGGVGEAGDPYERHADAVADLVVQGVSSEALLDAHAGPGSAAGGAVQRLAFVKGKQLRRTDPTAKDAAAAALITDNLVHSYESPDELQLHAAGGTDYLGNLPDANHTWVRFNPRGLNILGEMHTEITLHMVTHAVGSTRFIDERLARDHLDEGSKLKAAYDRENADAVQNFGIAGEQNPELHGAESLFPKLGYVMTGLLPYLDGTEPLSKISTEEGYYGLVYQRYLTMAWAHAKDVKAQVVAMQAIGKPMSHAMTQLATVVTLVEPELDGFITALPVGGFLGDAIGEPGTPRTHDRLNQLGIFARAFIHVMVDRAIGDPSSRMKSEDKSRFAGHTDDKDKAKLFENWRNFQFEDSVNDAAKRDVRYAGMGWAHFEHLRNMKTPLPPDSHLVDMNGDDLAKFRTETAQLKGRAVRP